MPVLVSGVNATPGERHHPSLSPGRARNSISRSTTTRAAGKSTPPAAQRGTLRSPPLFLFRGSRSPRRRPKKPKSPPSRATGSRSISFIGLDLEAAHASSIRPPARTSPSTSARRIPWTASPALAAFFPQTATLSTSMPAPRMTWALRTSPCRASVRRGRCGSTTDRSSTRSSTRAAGRSVATRLFRATRSRSSSCRRAWIRPTEKSRAASRATASGTFQLGSVVGDWPDLAARPLASPEWLSPDGCRLYITAYSDAAFRGIYVAERER